MTTPFDHAESSIFLLIKRGLTVLLDFCVDSFECQHLMHSLQRNGVRRWVALSEGAGGGVGWLTTNERKEVLHIATLRPKNPHREKTQLLR